MAAEEVDLAEFFARDLVGSAKQSAISNYRAMKRANDLITPEQRAAGIAAWNAPGGGRYTDSEDGDYWGDFSRGFSNLALSPEGLKGAAIIATAGYAAYGSGASAAAGASEAGAATTGSQIGSYSKFGQTLLPAESAATIGATEAASTGLFSSIGLKEVTTAALLANQGARGVAEYFGVGQAYDALNPPKNDTAAPPTSAAPGQRIGSTLPQNGSNAHLYIYAGLALATIIVLKKYKYI